MWLPSARPPPYPRVPRSIATGLYPAWHGIVSNSFTWGNDTFRMNSLDPKWRARARRSHLTPRAE